MSKFKVGDKVQMKGGATFDNGQLVATIVKIDNSGMIQRKHWLDTNTWVFSEYLEKAEDTSKHHKHHDLIIAWAKGAEIEMYSGAGIGWTCTATPTPSWDEDIQYRVKPKTDKERIKELEARVEELEKQL